ncbi:MAG: hypothetical protein K2X82_11990 [Gemmataceae bacterium]|nr:hypothetical protein [Gemmataceae bacterium]
MTTVAIPELTTRLPELLERVANGERIPLTDGGRPVAVLGPPDPPATDDVRRVIAEMRELRKGNTLGDGLTVRQLIEEGRRS